MGKIYLGRHGQIYGPFSSQQMEALQASGEIERYTWLWHAGRSQWEPLDPCPTEQPTEQTAAPSLAPSARLAERAPRAVVSFDASGLEVVCHDMRSLLSGHLLHVTESGCEFVSRHEGADPELSTQGRVFLNLLDASTGESMTVAARITEIGRAGGHWRYRMTWGRAPEILAQAAG